jgi:hypothetical protein
MNDVSDVSDVNAVTRTRRRRRAGMWSALAGAALCLALGVAPKASAEPLPEASPDLAVGFGQPSSAVGAPAKASSTSSAALRHYIERAQGAQPEAFTAVSAAKASVVGMDRRRRGPLAVVSRPLKALGPDALAPMLAELMVASDPTARPEDLTERQHLTWVVGLIEAIGSQRDPIALPALSPLLDDPRHSPKLLFAAAQAIGKVGTDDAAALLAARVQALTTADLLASDPRRDALLGASGSCRRALMADTLQAAALSWPPQADLASTRALIRALHDIANAQAWKTPIIRASGDEARVRAAATTALTSLWRSHPDQRDALAIAFRIIDTPLPE